MAIDLPEADLPLHFYTGGILTLAALLKLTFSQPKSGVSDALEALIIVSIILSAFLMTLQVC